MLDTVAQCNKAGLPVEIVTGGSTGTYNIDTENHLTELQAGSYIFMDTLYRKIGGKWFIVQEHVSIPVDLNTMKPDPMSKP